MYDLGDFGKSFDAGKVGKGVRVPRFPKVEGNFGLVLKRLIEKEGDTAGKMFVATFAVTRSSADQVLVGATYEKAYFQGASKVDREKCWRKILPLLLAVTGEDATNVSAVANAPVALGDLLECSTDKKDEAGKVTQEGTDLDMPVNLTVKLESARPDKATDKVPPQFIDEKTGLPMIFATDTWTPAPVAAQAAA
jgi:hypothetical protein